MSCMKSSLSLYSKLIKNVAVEFIKIEKQAITPKADYMSKQATLILLRGYPALCLYIFHPAKYICWEGWRVLTVTKP